MTESAAAAAPDTPVTFSGSRREIARIAFGNTLLTVLTLGIYRFWAKTRLRQFYWEHIAIGGSPLEYTGRATELLIGFLIAMVALAILSVIGGVLQFYVGFGDLQIDGLAELFSYIVIGWLYGFAVFRARRYRLTRTLWRGIRFGQDGSAMRYAWMRFGWLLLLVVSFGVVRPWFDVALRRYEMTHTRFGFSRFSYTGRGRDLFPYWWPVLLPMAAIGVAIALLGFEVNAAMQRPDLPETGPEAFSAALKVAFDQPLAGVAVVVFLISLAAAVLLMTRYRVAALRYLFAVSRLEGVTCQSQARTPRILLYATTFTLLTIAALAVGGVAILLFDGPGVVLFVIAFMATGILNQVFFVFPMVRHIAATLGTSDISALEDVVQATRDDPRFGEGLLDALDFDMGAF